MGQSMPNNQGHVNSVLLEKMKQQVFSTIPYSSGQSPALIHHLPQAKEESTPDPASVPTTQVGITLNLNDLMFLSIQK